MSNNIDKKLIAYLLAAPVNHPESWATDDDEEFMGKDMNDPEIQKKAHEYFGIGPIGRKGPYEPLEPDEIEAYLNEHPDKLASFQKDYDSLEAEGSLNLADESEYPEYFGVKPSEAVINGVKGRM